MRSLTGACCIKGRARKIDGSSFMRLLLGILICGAAVSASGQCPIQPRQPSSDAGSVIIRYYNSSPRAALAVQFTVTKLNGVQNGQSISANYSVKAIVNPKHERTAVFANRARTSTLSSGTPTGPVEVQVTRVSFADLSTWTPPRENPCKVSFSQR